MKQIKIKEINNFRISNTKIIFDFVDIIIVVEVSDTDE